MNRETILSFLQAIIYEGGHWANQDKKIDEILTLIDNELFPNRYKTNETADEYNERNRIS